MLSTAGSHDLVMRAWSSCWKFSGARVLLGGCHISLYEGLWSRLGVLNVLAKSMSVCLQKFMACGLLRVGVLSMYLGPFP